MGTCVAHDPGEIGGAPPSVSEHGWSSWTVTLGKRKHALTRGELPLIVVGGDYDIAPLVARMIETIVVEDPPPDRVIFGTD